MAASAASDFAASDSCSRMTRDRRRNPQARDAAEQAMQLVAVEIADALRRVEQRARPTRDRRIDLAQRLAAILGVGGDHDRDVMIGQRHRQFGLADDIEHHQFDAGFLEQELDRRVAAHVGRRRQRQNAQPRIPRNAGRAEQLMGQQHLVLDGKAGRLVAEQLGDQRQVEPLARLRTAIEQLRDQLRPDRPKILAVEGHLREPRHADAIGAAGAGSLRQLEGPRVHMTTPQRPCRLHAQAKARSWRRPQRRDRVRAAGFSAQRRPRSTTSR